jgi:hypothetical protein
MPEVRMERLSPDRTNVAMPGMGLMLFLVGFGSSFYFHVVGNLYYSEGVLALVTIFVFFLRLRKYELPPVVTRMLVLLLLWLLSQIASDIVRQTPFEDFSRGWAKIVFFGSDMVALVFLIGHSELRLRRFVLGFAAGSLLSLIIEPPIYYESGAIWKFGLAFPISLIVVLISSYSKGRLLPVLALLLLSTLNFLLDFRSLAGISFMTAALVAYGSISIASRNQTTGLLKKLAWLSSFAVLGIALWIAYLWGVESRFSLAFGGRDMSSDADRNPLYGRLEVIIGMQAIRDSPLLGYASWAKNPDYVSMLQDLSEELGRTIYVPSTELIPSHSFLVGAWVEAGILGALFWFYVMGANLKTLWIGLKGDADPRPLLIFLLTWFAWAILLSPFGGSQRITAAMAVASMAAYRSVRPR